MLDHLDFKLSLILSAVPFNSAAHSRGEESALWCSVGSGGGGGGGSGPAVAFGTPGEGVRAGGGEAAPRGLRGLGTGHVGEQSGWGKVIEI